MPARVLPPGTPTRYPADCSVTQHTSWLRATGRLGALGPLRAASGALRTCPFSHELVNET